MPSQSINTEMIKLPDTITPSTLSKAFALLLIGVYEMIDYFSGVDTDYFCCESFLLILIKKRTG